MSPKDAHGLKIQGRGYLMFFAKALGGLRLSGTIARGLLDKGGYNNAENAISE
jgi:hypothetical protein